MIGPGEQTARPYIRVEQVLSLLSRMCERMCERKRGFLLASFSPSAYLCSVFREERRTPARLPPPTHVKESTKSN